jgi:hypothetical protein
LWIAGGSVAFVGASTAGCGSLPDASAVTQIALPNFGEFAGDGTNAGVHQFLEKRCGTLDCHGQIGRPFRLFSPAGLRLRNDAGLVPGVGADTPDELYANYTSLVGLQPEETSRVVQGLDPPSTLLVVAKPLDLQTHKGGQVLASGDAGDVCLESWLRGAYDATSCNTAAQVP